MTYEFYASRKEPVFTSFSVAPVGGALGAEIRGLDLSEPLSKKAAAEVYQALLHYMVIFFRDQELTPARHLEFARVFGEPQMGGAIPRLDEQPEVKKQEYTMAGQIGGVVNMHADDSFLQIPSKCSVLYGVKMPEAGGDTCWVNCEAAYAALSAPMRAMLEPLKAVHDLAATFGYADIEGGKEDFAAKSRIREHYPPVEHPVIRTHPETGRKCIFVSEMDTTRIVGLTRAESRVILDYLLNHLRNPIFHVRLHWTNGTVAVWDNRSTQHFFVPDFQPSYRLNHRVAIRDTLQPA